MSLNIAIGFAINASKFQIAASRVPVDKSVPIPSVRTTASRRIAFLPPSFCSNGSNKIGFPRQAFVMEHQLTIKVPDV